MAYPLMTMALSLYLSHNSVSKIAPKVIIVVHISFAVAVFRDATSLPASRKPISVSPTIWFLAILLGGIFIPFLKDYIALAVLRKYANEVILAIADFGYLPRISLNCCCICANV